MPGASSCPASRDLLRFALGQFEDDKAEAFEQHLEECERCQRKINKLEEEQTEFEEEEPTGAASAAPVAGEGAPDEATAPVDVGVPLLKPAQGPGEIGRLGPYRVLRVLGSGGAGVVYQAEDSQLRRPVALKVMRPAEHNREESRQRFLREGRLAASLEHDHIMTIYQVGEDDGVPYLAMQLLQGETLDARLKRKKQLDVFEVLRISREIALGLKAAHAEGMVHRDIKPSNIWLESKGDRVKIVDFGLARSLTDDVHLTKTGTVIGTPAYMAPEQARGVKVDFRCDLYSLGAVMYRMGTGHTPFEANDTMGMLLALAHEQVRPMQAFNPDVPGPLQGLAFRLLAKHPQARPTSASEVLQELDFIEEYLARQLFGEDEVKPRSNTRRTVFAMLLLAGLAFAIAWYWPQLSRFFEELMQRSS